MSATRAGGRRRTAAGRLVRSRAGAALRWLVPRLAVLVSRVVFGSCRVRFVGVEHERQFGVPGRQFIFAAWHEGILMLPYYFRHYRDRPPVVMVSASRDGDLIAGAIARFGLRPVRGSSRRGGIGALKAMLAALRDPGCAGAGIIVDGPQGPPREAKPGAILLARATGLPIVAAAWWARPQVRFKSWDRTLLPLPFARLAMVYAEPLYVPRDADEGAMKACCDALTERLARARREAQAAVGVDATG